jgi:cyclophilin family peptidyl-prolyl cis-trans isomerase
LLKKERHDCVSVIETGNGARVSRRRALAFGAAGLATAALAACGGGSSATETPKGAAATVAPLASQVPSGLAATAQAIASTVPGGAAAIASKAAQVASPAAAQASPAANAAANTADVASRNNKYKAAPPMKIDKGVKYTATIATNKGTMKADLFADTAPVTVNNFVFLANDHFYDGVIFHRIVAGFVIQGGDPTGTGTGGPGYKFPDEPSSFSKNYEKGTLAMANSGPNTNGSQFFICVDNLTAKGALPKQYTIFGKVSDGLDVIDKILAVPRSAGSDGAQSKPTEKVFMENVTIQTQ